MPIDGVRRLPTRLLSFTSADGELVPRWLGDRDRPWLRDLLEDAQALDGQPFATWQRRWASGEADPRAGSERQRIAVHVLGRWLRDRSKPKDLSHVRRELFAQQAAGVDRERALRAAAERHGKTAEQLARGLYDDLPERRPIRWPATPLDPGALAAAANLALAQGMLHHAEHVHIDVRGGSRALLRTAWLLGMRVELQPRGNDATRVTWRSDPAQPRQRAPTSLVALLPWTNRYRLRARCTIARSRGDLVLATGDPLQPGPEPRRYDSALERRFAREFTAAHPDWKLLREPCAVATAHGVAFPDFSLQAPGAEPWLCEIAGLRDPSALQAKAALLNAHPRVVLCVPRAAMTAALRADARVVPFSRRVDPLAVAAVIERASR